jgi:hypothetical protein
MIKIIMGAAILVALVGYGVITPNDVERAGHSVVNGVNTLAKTVDEVLE